ncbi:MAG: hypothetical protein M1822_003685 [Bathelium mastoideum]|nr:MAG: hypothetical protein M1822_003685 [Bathelium mastoideum]
MVRTSGRAPRADGAKNLLRMYGEYNTVPMPLYNNDIFLKLIRKSIEYIPNTEERRRFLQLWKEDQIKTLKGELGAVRYQVANNRWAFASQEIFDSALDFVKDNSLASAIHFFDKAYPLDQAWAAERHQKIKEKEAEEFERREAERRKGCKGWEPDKTVEARDLTHDYSSLSKIQTVFEEAPSPEPEKTGGANFSSVSAIQTVFEEHVEAPSAPPSGSLGKRKRESSFSDNLSELDLPAPKRSRSPSPAPKPQDPVGEAPNSPAPEQDHSALMAELFGESEEEEEEEEKDGGLPEPTTPPPPPPAPPAASPPPAPSSSPSPPVPPSPSRPIRARSAAPQRRVRRYEQVNHRPSAAEHDQLPQLGVLAAEAAAGPLPPERQIQERFCWHVVFLIVSSAVGRALVRASS